MADSFIFAVNGIDNLHDFQLKKDETELLALQTINRIAATTRKDAADKIRAEVAFGQSYLNPANKRLYVSQQARKGSLEAVITARGRPTSLARFIVGGTAAIGQEGVTVEVGQGRIKHLDHAFLIKLRAGTSDVETRFNLGLAVRLKPGNDLRNKRANVIKLNSGLHILYGPSVSQIFLANDGTGVADDLVPDILDGMQEEFLRLVRLKQSGKL
jgi:hypothetical protein